MFGYYHSRREPEGCHSSANSAGVKSAADDRGPGVCHPLGVDVSRLHPETSWQARAQQQPRHNEGTRFSFSRPYPNFPAGPSDSGAISFRAAARQATKPSYRAPIQSYGLSYITGPTTCFSYSKIERRLPVSTVRNTRAGLCIPSESTSKPKIRTRGQANHQRLPL